MKWFMLKSIVFLSICGSGLASGLTKTKHKESAASLKGTLRVGTGLLSVKLSSSFLNKYSSSDRSIRSQGQRGSVHSTKFEDKQSASPLTIALFIGERAIRLKECGDRQCLLKISPDETAQLVSQSLHANLPERTDPLYKKSKSVTTLVGPMPSLRIGLLSPDARKRLEGSRASTLTSNVDDLQQLSASNGLLWVNQLKFEVAKTLIRTQEVSVIREPAFIPVPLVDLIEKVSCSGAECLLTRQGIELFSINPKRTKLRIKVRLKRGAYLSGQQSEQRGYTFSLPLKRCSIATPQVPLLGNIRQHKFLLAISRGCGAGKYRSIAVKTWPPTRASIIGEVEQGDSSWRYFEVLFEETPNRGESLEISLVKEKRQEVLLGTVAVSLRHDFHPRQIRLSLQQLGPIDFVPTNQVAVLSLAYDKPVWYPLLKPKGFIGFYQVSYQKQQREQTTGVSDSSKKIKKIDLSIKRYNIRAERGASGDLPMLIGYQPQYKAPFESFNKDHYELATFRTENRYALRRVNTPIRLTSARLGKGVVEVSCLTARHRLEITSKVVALIPFESRHSCRVIIYKDRIPPEVGEQHILVTEDNEKFRQIVTVSHGVGEIVISIPVKKSKEFDRLEIGVGHNYSSAEYDFAPQQDLGAESRYEVVLGDRSFGVSLSTSLPTGLFRYGFSKEDRSSVALSAGGIGKLLWLWREGRPFPVGIDFGALVTGIDNEPHLSIIGGLGVSVPVLNANTPFEASFNLHAWFEYAPTRNEEGQSPWSLLFGPSFAVGKFSTNL